MKPSKNPPPQSQTTWREAFANLDAALGQNTRSSAFTDWEQLDLIRLKLFGRIAEKCPQPLIP